MRENRPKDIDRVLDRATPADVKTHYGTASILKDGRAVFNYMR